MRSGDIELLKELKHHINAAGNIAKLLKASIPAYSSDHVDLCRFFKSIGDEYDELSDQKKFLNDVYDTLSRDTVPEALRGQGVKTTTIEGVGRVTISQRYSASIVPDKKDGAYQWLRDRDYGGMIMETVNSSTLSGFAKNLIVEQGKELPEEFFKVSTSTHTSITKVK